MPEAFLNFLHEKWPNARIVVDAQQVSPMKVKYSLNCNSAFVWPSSRCLHTFVFKATRKCEFDHRFKQNLFQTIKRSPNLKILQIRDFVSGLFGQLDDMSSELRYPGDLAAGVRERGAMSEGLPQLEELTLTGLTLPLFTHNELNVWGSTGGWEKLKRLKLKPSDFLPAFLGRVPSLEVLDCSSYLSRAFEDYAHPAGQGKPIALLGALRELEYQGPGITFPIEVLQHVSRTLVSLKMHNANSFVHRNGSTKPADTQFRDILILNDTCPRLETLAVDMWREGVWPYEFLTALAQFRSLTDITLFVERPSDVGISPAVDKQSCKHIFEFIQDHKCGRRLRRLEIKQYKIGVTIGPGSSLLFQGPVDNIFPDFACASTKEGGVLVKEVYWQQGAKCNREAEKLRLLTKNIEYCSTERLVRLAREFNIAWTEQELSADVLAEGDKDLDDDFSIGPIATPSLNVRGLMSRLKGGSGLVPRVSESRGSKPLDKIARLLCLGRQSQPRMEEGKREHVIKQVLLQRMMEMRAKEFFHDDATLFDIINSYPQAESCGDASLTLYKSLLEVQRIRNICKNDEA